MVRAISIQKNKIFMKKFANKLLKISQDIAFKLYRIFCNLSGIINCGAFSIQKIFSSIFQKMASACIKNLCMEIYSKRIIFTLKI
jgi:hypothetical protein